MADSKIDLDVILFKERHPSAEQDPYEQAIQEQCGRAHFVPLLQIDFLTSSQAKQSLRDALSSLHRYSGIIYTSAQSVAACERLANEEKNDDTTTTPTTAATASSSAAKSINQCIIESTLPIYCVGPATANCARALGFPNVRLPQSPDGNAKVLAAEILAEGPREAPLLLIMGEMRLPYLTDTFQAKNVAYEEVFVYRTGSRNLTGVVSDLESIVQEQVKEKKEKEKELGLGQGQQQAGSAAGALHPVVMAFFSPSGVRTIQPLLCAAAAFTPSPSSSSSCSSSSSSSSPSSSSHPACLSTDAPSMSPALATLLRSALPVAIGQTTEAAFVATSSAATSTVSTPAASSFSWSCRAVAKTPTPSGLLAACLEAITSTTSTSTNTSASSTVAPNTDSLAPG